MAKQKRCSYCGNKFDSNKHKKTKEHVFPNGIIKLYPEQYINYSPGGNFIDKSGSVIKDVCAFCNNGVLSALDAYGVSLIQTNFYESLEKHGLDYVHQIEVDYYRITRWLLKIIYNYLRQKKEFTNWFEDALPYILNNNLCTNIQYSLFMGLHINASPLPEEFFRFTPIQICPFPKLLGNSLNIHAYGIDPYINQVKLQGTEFNVAIRFGNAIFYLILWKKDIGLSYMKYGNSLLNNEFNFTQITSSVTKYNLRRVSAHTNSAIGYNHLISTSGLEFDQKTNMAMTSGRDIYDQQVDLRERMGEDGIKRGRALSEMAMFPGNKFVQKNYKKAFDKEDK